MKKIHNLILIIVMYVGTWLLMLAQFFNIRLYF